MIDAQADAFLKRINTPQKYSLHTRQAYATDVRSFVHFLRKSGQSTPTLDDFTSGRVQAYIDHQRKLGLQPSTLNRRRASLRRFAHYLQLEGLIQKDPTRNITASLDVNEAPVVVPVFTLADVQQLETEMAVKPHARSLRDRAVLALLLETGFSTSRLVDLDLTHFDVQHNQLNFNHGEDEVLRTTLMSSGPALKSYVERGRPELSAPDEICLVRQPNGRSYDPPECLAYAA